MRKRRLHPERILMAVVLPLGVAAWGLGLAGFFLNKPELYQWAGLALITGIATSLIPLLGFLLFLAIEKFFWK